MHCIYIYQFVKFFKNYKIYQTIWMYLLAPTIVHAIEQYDINAFKCANYIKIQCLFLLSFINQYSFHLILKRSEFKRKIAIKFSFIFIIEYSYILDCVTLAATIFGYKMEDGNIQCESVNSPVRNLTNWSHENIGIYC